MNMKTFAFIAIVTISGQVHATSGGYAHNLYLLIKYFIYIYLYIFIIIYTLKDTRKMVCCTTLVG